MLEEIFHPKARQSRTRNGHGKDGSENTLVFLLCILHRSTAVAVLVSVGLAFLEATNRESAGVFPSNLP